MTIPWLTLVGHVSFLLAAVSFWMTSMFWLRTLAIASLLVGIGYNATLAVREVELWTVVQWQVAFLGINVFMAVRVLIANSEIRLSEQHRTLLSIAFPSMKSRAFKALMDAGSVVTWHQGDVLAEIGTHMDRCYLVTRGEIVLTDAAGVVSSLGRGRMVGDLTAALGEQYGGSPVRITASEGVETISWPHGVIAALKDKSPEIAWAFTDAVLRGVVKKVRLLLPDGTAATEGTPEVLLGPAERFLHAALLPGLSSRLVRDLFDRGIVEEIPAGGEIDNTGRVGFLLSGVARVVREDDQQILLARGNVIGEVAWLAERPIAVAGSVVADEPCAMLWLTYEDLASVKGAHPALFVGLVEHLARNMAIKLTWPLTGDGRQKPGVYDFTADRDGVRTAA